MSKKKYKLNLKKFIPFCLVCALIITAAGFFVFKIVNKQTCEHEFAGGICEKCGLECSHDYTEGICAICGEEDPDFIKPDEIHKISIACAGDAMAHITNLRSQYNDDGTYYTEDNQNCSTDGTFSFSENFKWIKEYIEEADLALVNFETTISDGPNYSGRPGGFSVPNSYALDLKDAGFDVVFTCNNHTLDTGVSGLKNTVEKLRKDGFTVVGTRLSSSEDRSKVIDVNGVKVGVVAYTYATSRVGEARTLNASRMPEEAVELINSYRFKGDRKNSVAAEEDKREIADEIQWCKKNGAEIVITYFHWDTFNEYFQDTTALEVDLAEFAAASGADVIFGSHPHVVQRVDEIEVTRDDGTARIVPVFYSLGNFISNQNKESFAALNDPNGAVCQEELLAKVDITYNRTKGTIEFDRVSALPLYVARYKDGNASGKYEYRIFPLVGNYQSNSDLVTSKQVTRAEDALKHITEVVGSQYIYTE